MDSRIRPMFWEAMRKLLLVKLLRICDPILFILRLFFEEFRGDEGWGASYTKLS